MDRVWDGQEPVAIFCAGGASALLLGILGLVFWKIAEVLRKLLTRCHKLRMPQLRSPEAMGPALEDLMGQFGMLKEEWQSLGLKVQMMEQSHDSLRSSVTGMAKATEDHLKELHVTLLAIKEDGHQRKEQLKHLTSSLGAVKDEGKTQREHLRKMAEGHRASLESLAGTINETRDAAFNTPP